MKWVNDFGDMLLSYAGILMAAIAGVFELIRDRFGARFTGKVWQSLSMVGIFGGMLWALLATQHDAREHRQEMEKTITSVNEWVKTQVTEGTTTVVNQAKQDTASIVAEVDALRMQLQNQGTLPSVAQSVSLDQASEILKAGNAARKLISSQAAPDRQHLTIHYYDHFTKDVNFEKVKPLLDKLADHVDPFKPMVDAPTNSVWWGPGSGIEQAKTVALLVTGAGVPVVQICQSSKPHSGIDNLIQIGGSKAAQRQLESGQMKAMTTEEIQGLTAARCAQGASTQE